MVLYRRQVLLGAAAALMPALTCAQAPLPEVMKIIVPCPPGNTLDGRPHEAGAV